MKKIEFQDIIEKRLEVLYKAGYPRGIVMLPEASQLLPTKIILDRVKGKTTLLYGDKPYESYSVKTHDGDIFTENVGLVYCFTKRLLGSNYNQTIKLVEAMHDNPENHPIMLSVIVAYELMKQGLSRKDIKTLFAGKRTKIKGKEYIVVGKHKIEVLKTNYVGKHETNS